MCMLGLLVCLIELEASGRFGWHRVAQRVPAARQRLRRRFMHQCPSGAPSAAATPTAVLRPPQKQDLPAVARSAPEPNQASLRRRRDGPMWRCWCGRTPGSRGTGRRCTSPCAPTAPAATATGTPWRATATPTTPGTGWVSRSFVCRVLGGLEALRTTAAAVLRSRLGCWTGIVDAPAPC